jgi:hypothetical protein
MNAKLKQDLYRVSLPMFRKTMLIGIDVIMQGNAKLIGCCATYNLQMTQVYSQLYKQKTPLVTPEIHEEYTIYQAIITLPMPLGRYQVDYSRSPKQTVQGGREIKRK